MQKRLWKSIYLKHLLEASMDASLLGRISLQKAYQARKGKENGKSVPLRIKSPRRSVGLYCKHIVCLQQRKSVRISRA